MADFALNIDIPRPNDAAFQAGFNNIFQTLDRAEAQLRRIDRLVQRTGGNIGGGRGGRGGAGGGGGSGRRRATGNDSFFGEGNSGRLPSILRAGGIGGSLATAAGALNPLSAGLIAGTFALKEFVAEATRFEAQLGEIGRVANFTAQELETFGNDVREISTEIPVATDQILRLASAGANAGLAGQQLAIFTREAAKLAALLPGISDTQIRGIIRISTLTGFPIERIGELNGALVRLQQTTKNTLPALITLSQRVAQDAGIFGATTEQVIALAATIGDLGLQPERASTAVGRLVGQLRQLDAQGRPAVNRLLNTFRDRTITAEQIIDLATNNPVEALRLIGEESVNTREALEALGITGKQNVIGSNVLANIETFNEVLKNAAPDDEIISDQLTKRLNEFDAQLKILKNSAVDLGRSIGESLIPVLTALIDVGTFVVNTFEDIQKGLEGLFFLIQTGDVDQAGLIASGLDEEIQQLEIRDRALRQILPLQAEANRLLREFGPTPAVIARIRELDETANRAIQRFTADFRDAGGSTKDLEEALKRLQAPGVLTRIEAQAKQTEAAFDRIASAAGEARKAVNEFRTDTDDVRFQIDIFNLDETEQKLRTIARDANQEFAGLLGQEIVTPDQERGLRKQFEDLALGLQIDVSTSGRDLVRQLEELNNADLTKDQRENLQALFTIADRLQQSESANQALRERRNAELDLLLKEQQRNIEKERANIARQQAPALAAITDAGRAVELFNAQKNTIDLQQEQIALAEERNDLLEEQIEEAKQRQLKVVTRN